MNIQRDRAAIIGLQWTLGLVVLIEAGFFAFAQAEIHSFGKTGLPHSLRLVIAFSEIVGAVLFLIPRTVVVGSWLLVAVFLGAAAIHLLHGFGNIGGLFIYAAAAFVVMTQQKMSIKE